jgi:flagellar hook protein FlgE
MSLSTELSGVQAAQNFIDNVGNNVANVNTTGFKLANTDFADLYGSAVPNAPGEGVETASLAQSFAQGQISQTGNPFDVAISGNGFFALQSSSGVVYSRDGSFQLDLNGNLSTAAGAKVLGFQGTGTSGAPQPIQVSTASLPGAATAKLSLDVNLPTGDAPIDTATHPFSTKDPASYNESTSVSVFDSLGTADSLTTYYTQVSGSGSPPQWATNWALTSSTGTLITSGAGPALKFDNSGALVSGSGTISAAALPDGAAPLNIAVDYTGSTLSNLAFGVNSVTNDGTGSGTLSGVTVGAGGQVVGRYSNGATKTFGTIALAPGADGAHRQCLGRHQRLGRGPRRDARLGKPRHAAGRRARRLERRSDGAAGQSDRRSAGLSGQYAGDQHRTAGFPETDHDPVGRRREPAGEAAA